MVDLACLPLRLSLGRVIPCFLGPEDTPWLSRLLCEYARFANKPKGQLLEYFKTELPFSAPEKKLKLARVVLDRLWKTQVVAVLPPQVVRAKVFAAAVGRNGRAEEVLNEVAFDLGFTPDELKQALLADLPESQHLLAPTAWPEPVEVVARANMLLVQSLLGRSLKVCLEFEGQTRAIVRVAKLRGLICSLGGAIGNSPLTLELSGPLALFRRTRLYGHALAALLPSLVWCNRFKLEAEVLLGDEKFGLTLETGAPIFPGQPPRKFDSRLEERFARDFCRLTTNWDLHRESEPIFIDEKMMFPDFSIVARKAPFTRWYLEIAGFWTPEYLRQKLADLKAANLDRLIVCVDEARNCTFQELPTNTRLVPYKRFIDAQIVLDVIEGAHAR